MTKTFLNEALPEVNRATPKRKNPSIKKQRANTTEPKAKKPPKPKMDAPETTNKQESEELILSSNDLMSDIDQEKSQSSVRESDPQGNLAIKRTSS